MSSPLAAQEPKTAPTPEASADAGSPAKPADGAAKKEAKVVKCEEHGVSKKLCTRCNPKLEPVFKAKGDWCQEHKRPESQCVICHPELEKQGVK